MREPGLVGPGSDKNFRETTMKRRSGIAALALLLLAGSHEAGAQTFPSRPIKIITAAGAASGIDVTFRSMADELSAILGQPVTIENKPGANGLIAIQEVLKARPDGHTLLGGNINTNSLMPVVDAKKLNFNIDEKLTPIMYVNHVPAVVAAAASVPDTLAGFVDHVRKNPGKVNYGVTAIGAYNHMDMLVLSKTAGLKMEPVVTPTVAAAATSLLNGDIQVLFLTAQATIPLLSDGKIRALAVTGDKRLAAIPNVPTMAEAGFPDIGSNVWQGLFAPAGTPNDALDKIFQAMRKALAAKSVEDSLSSKGFVQQPSASPEEFRAYLKKDMAKWAVVARENNLDK